MLKRIRTVHYFSGVSIRYKKLKKKKKKKNYFTVMHEIFRREIRHEKVA